MNDRMTRILVCDDEPHLREMICEYLTERGFGTTQASDAKMLLAAVEVELPDLIILDVNMPGMDGLSALRELRTSSTVPVIMLTAAVDVIDRVLGLEMGADDYVGKPVDLRELEARIKAALRRQIFSSEEVKKKVRIDGTVAIGQCRLDIDGAKLYGADGNEIAITAMEFSLLRVFVENKGRILNRDQLLEQAHDRGWEPFDRSIDLRISRIRRKIEANPTKPEVIRTVRGLGYVFE
ncbi:response regulator transcription factor [uncultured Parasphingorhabdus sp.]|uniref:response regulator transcription factor n=1 Tax=uncultured Parasphingorhabdus sp. TaxID=2709694 RepID=UPI0030DB7D3B|tara:strand:- start:48064 stop:48774 length:711 start_codon:yes stop_codon:yes gene_type:complete